MGFPLLVLAEYPVGSKYLLFSKDKCLRVKGWSVGVAVLSSASALLHCNPYGRRECAHAQPTLDRPFARRGRSGLQSCVLPKSSRSRRDPLAKPGSRGRCIVVGRRRAVAGIRDEQAAASQSRQFNPGPNFAAACCSFRGRVLPLARHPRIVRRSPPGTEGTRLHATRQQRPASVARSIVRCGTS